MKHHATAFIRRLAASLDPGGGARASVALKRAFEQSKTGLGARGHGADAVATNSNQKIAQVDVINSAICAMAANAQATGSGVVSDTGVLTIPFGDHKIEATRPDGTTFWCWQRLDSDSLDEMRTGWRGVLQKLTFWFLRIPVYEGHPDRVDAMSEDEKEQLVRGTVKAIEDGDGELRLPVAWNGSGKDVRPLYNSNSPHWLLADTGKNKDGLPVMRPSMLLSVGLTNTPNIQGSAINEKTKQQQENPKMKELIAKLRLMLELEDDLSDEQVLKRATEHYGQMLNTLHDAQAKLEEAERMKKSAEVDAAKAKEDLDVAKQDAQTAKAEVASKDEEIASKAEAVVDAAIEEGRIPVADRPAWIKKLDADPIGGAVAAANSSPKLKVDEKHAQNAKGRTDAEPMTQFLSVVRAYMTAQGLTGSAGYNQAWNECQKTHAALWEGIGKGN